ncbi:MAG: NAD(P)-binding domain-containing protein, partial [Deltaproteobacteria bacterium]|nr:NAD(P)-binding domain-containing protein [Deltaproteobacteria bacterium]
MKVLIADKLDASAVRSLADRGAEVESRPELKADDLPAAIAELDPDVLVVRSTKVSGQAIRAGQLLKLIVRAGAGYDTIDVDAASSAGVFIANCPGKNSVAVAELTWGLILAADRRIAAQDRMLKHGKWDKKGFAKASGIYGRTLGVIGLGTIGQEVTRRALAFGMRVVAWSRSLDDSRAAQLEVTRAATPLDVAREADVLTVHVAATPDTKGLISRELIDAMKDGATLINTSRGSVVDEAALMHGIESKGLRAGLDVYQNEPGSGDKAFESPVARSEAVVGTHHVGASTDQSQEAIAAEVARIIIEFITSGEVPNCVNLDQKSAHDTLLTVRHKNRPG